MDPISSVLSIAFSAALLGFAALESIALRRGAPFVPTPGRIVDLMLERAELRPGETLVDLGCGDGRIACAAARRGARAVGIEQSRFLASVARLRAVLAGLGDLVEVRRGDLFSADVSRADVITCFLLQDTNQRLAGKLLRECKPGARVVSHAFTFAGWPEELRDPRHPTVHVYRLPARVWSDT